MFIMIPDEAGRPCLIQVEHIAAVLPLENGSTIALRVSVDAMMPDGATARIPMEIVTSLSVAGVAAEIVEAGDGRVASSVVAAIAKSDSTRLASLLQSSRVDSKVLNSVSDRHRWP